MNQTTFTVQEAIDNLYHTFAIYRLNPHMEACPCCVYDEDKRHLQSKPLQKLSTSDLCKYAYKALSTLGNENDFKHFLPRLFEIITFEAIALTDPEILFGKLDYAEWHNWPLHEQKAIELYFSALWEYLLNQTIPEDYTIVGSYLCGIAKATQNVEPFLKMWQSNSDQNARLHLQFFLTQHCEEFLAKEFRSDFWNTCPEQAHQVIVWAAEQENGII